MVFVYHVTLQDHVIKALNDFMVRSPSRYVTTLPLFVAISNVVVKIKIILVCHVISQDHMIKESCNFMSRSPSR